MDFDNALHLLTTNFDLLETPDERIIDHLSEWLVSEPIVSLHSSVSVLGFLDHLLHKFITANFLGGCQTQNSDTYPVIDRIAVTKLSCEGEAPFKGAKHLGLLWLCDRIARHMCNSSTTMCLYLHQHLLGRERSARLSEELNTLLRISDHSLSFDDISCGSDVASFLILAAYLCVFYYQYERADKLTLKCAEYLGLDLRFTGVMAKRHKFQVDSVACLFIQVNRNTEAPTEALLTTPVVPKAIKLNDDSLLEQVSYDGIESNQLRNLTFAEQGLVLLLSELLRLAHPRDDMTAEQRLTYINLVLEHAYPEHANRSGPPLLRRSSWPIATEALFCRSLLEYESPRRLDRALAQLEELREQFGRAEPASTERGYDCFFYSRMPSIWNLEIENACLLKKLGCHKSALDIYLRWNQWSDIIECYTALHKREKAEEVIRAQIDSGDHSPELYCALGDVTNNREHYQKAWEISEHRSARAMRSLAVVHMCVDKDYEKAIECFEKSLEINSLQVNLWFTFGCCCLQAKEYAKAETAFRRCVQLNPDNFEAWNNCASAALLRGRKDVGLRLLKEACKCNFEDWRIWENICCTSADVGSFNDTIQACHRLLDLRPKFTDVQVLAVLTKAVLENIADSSGEPAANLKPKILELFGRITASNPNNADIWLHYANLLLHTTPLQVTQYQRVIRYLLSAHRCRIQPSEGSWEKSKEKREAVVDGLIRATNLVLHPPEVEFPDSADPATCNQDAFINSTLASLRLAFMFVVARLRHVEKTTVSTDGLSEVVQLREKAQQFFRTISRALSMEVSDHEDT